jgi:predicted hotdog family 3-hydroxylacyl-ACP dehydratase
MKFPMRASQLVPHQAPMVLLDTILSYDPAEGTVAQVEIREDAPFATRDGVPAWVGIEYMAQCIAAFGGCEALARGDPPPIGYLLGTRRYEARQPIFSSGAILVIRAKPLFTEGGMGSFACSIEAEGQEVGTATINTFTPQAETSD